MKQSRWGVAVLVALAASMVVTGCSIAPSGGATGGGTGGSGQSGQGEGGETSGDTNDDTENSGDSASPGDVDLDELQGLPETFPLDEVPLIDHPVELGVDLGTGWSIMMKVDDFQAAFADATGLLTGAGFESIAETVSASGGVGVFQNEKYQVQLSASDTPDNGPVLTYVVILRG